MNFAVYWTVFNILVVLPMKTYSRCYDPIDEQCFIGCYYYHGVCERCANCTRTQLVDIQTYHRSECTSFPALCKRQTRYVDWRDYATDFYPINLPPLLGSFIGERHQWLLPFFQEGSYPTIGKLCLNEAQKIPTEWFTFQKARLDCTSPDGVIYSNLVAVKNHSYNTSLYFALMSSYVDNKNQSALCLFTYREIESVFNSKIYYDPTYSDEWRAFPSDSIPYGLYDIGVCSSSSQWTDQQKNFIRTHPLMYNNVTTSQVLVEGDGRFTAIESIAKKGRDEKKHIMVFIGTDDGRILKNALIDLDTDPNFLEEIYFTQDPSVGITSLEIIGSPSRLKIWTTDSEEPMYEPLQRCRDMESQCVCEQDPYCIWNDDDGSCRSFDWNYNRDAQPPITKKSCEGILPGSALLVTNRHGRLIPSSEINTSSPTVTIETTTTKTPIGPDPEAKIGQPEPSGPWAVFLFLVCFVSLLLALVVICFLWHTGHWRSSPTEQNLSLDHKDWTSDWTSITFNQKFPFLKLKDPTEGGTEYTGKVDKSKTVFDNLKPLTDYEVIHYSDRTPFLVTTKGPSFSEWVVEVDTVKVKADGIQAQYESHLVLKSEGGITPHRKSLEESVMFSGLTPNMKYGIWLEVCKKDSEEVIDKCIKEVITKEESFRVRIDDGKPRLMWANLPSGFERYIQCCVCAKFQNFLSDMTHLVSGSKHLPPQPQSAKFTLKVMTKIPLTDGGELEHTLASVTYNTPPLALVKLSEQSSPILSSLPEDSNGLVMIPTQNTPDIDDSSCRVHSLPVSEEGDNEGSCDDSSSKIRSAPTLGIDFKEISPLVSRQMSEETSKYIIMGNNANVFLNSQVTLNNGASTSSGIGSWQSSRSSFGDLPFKGHGLKIGEECYQCSATLYSLTTIINEVRLALCLKIFLSKEDVIPCLCQLLNYSKDQTDVYKLLRNPNDSLRPIAERDVQSEQISVVTLLYKLMEILIDLSQLSQMGREKTQVEKMQALYNVIYFLATSTHGDCTACKAILDSVNHLWICGGYEEVPEDRIRSPLV